MASDKSPKYNPVVVCSIHGFKTHGKWQKKFSDFFSSHKFPVWSFDYGYKFLLALLPGFKQKLINDFFNEYHKLVIDKHYKIDLNNPIKRPSIVAHSLGSYILCNALLKYPEIKFDKVILCGSIIKRDFDWNIIFRRNQVTFLRNEYSPKDKVVIWGWILSFKGAGLSGKKGFQQNSDFIEEKKYEHFHHSDFFEGNHMEDSWLPFFRKPPPALRIIRGTEINSIDNFRKYFEQTREIDEKSFGADPCWDEYKIPLGRSEDWIEQCSDIYSFLSRDVGSFPIVGYINAMMLREEVFDNLLSGNIHDKDIQPGDIISNKNDFKEVDIYIMSIAIDPDFRNSDLGLFNRGLEMLYNSFIGKLEEYYSAQGLKVRRIAGIGWTEKGIQLCKMLGMKFTNVYEETTNKPIYALDLRDDDGKAFRKELKKLKRIYGYI